MLALFLKLDRSQTVLPVLHRSGLLSICNESTKLLIPDNVALLFQSVSIKIKFLAPEFV